MGTALTDDDRQLLDHLRLQGPATIEAFCQLLGVTTTAVRQRVQRLMAEGLIERAIHRHGRGRPSHRYSLTDKGRKLGGTNYSDLAESLWEELQAIPDTEVRFAVLSRLSKNLAGKYAAGVVGGGDSPSDLVQRMQKMVGLMAERDVPSVVGVSRGLPVLSILACPYPNLVDNDRSVCAMEREMISELLGRGVELSECRLDGGACCSFELIEAELTQAAPEEPNPSR